MLTFLLKKMELLAILQFAGHKDIRYYLNGICLEVGATESRLIATDGNVLGLLRLPDIADAALTETVQYIIPYDTIAKLKLKKGTPESVTLAILGKDNGGVVSAEIVDGSNVYRFNMVEGKYPDYRRVIPKKVSGLASQIDPELLLCFKKASSIFGSKHGHFAVAMDATGAALVSMPDVEERFTGVCMGWKVLNASQTLQHECPAWVNEALVATGEMVQQPLPIAA